MNIGSEYVKLTRRGAVVRMDGFLSIHWLGARLRGLLSSMNRGFDRFSKTNNRNAVAQASLRDKPQERP